MGYSHRKLNKQKRLYLKWLQKPVSEIITLMPEGFTDNVFISKFKFCYEYLWLDLWNEWKFYQRKSKTLEGKKPLLFPSPYCMVLSAASHLLRKVRSGHFFSLSNEQKIDKERRLVEISQKKMEKRNMKVQQNKELLQNIVPNYADNMIQLYFFMKQKFRDNVDGRYYVLKEMAKFNNERFVAFFCKVMNSDSNVYCREFALQTLQN